MESFVRNETLYAERFRAFKTEQLEKEKPYLRSKVLPVFARTLSNTCKNSNQNINILSVGAGEGEPDIYLLQELQKVISTSNDLKINYIVVEMNQQFLTSFQENVKKNSDVLRHVEFHWLCARFNEVQDKVEWKSKFDIIVLYHVLYYMDIEKTLKQCIEKLIKAKGCVFCMVSTQQDFSTQLHYQWKLRNEKTFRDPSNRSVEYVQKVGQDNNWKHDWFIINTTMEVGALFDPESVRGRLVWDFLFQKKDAVDILGQQRMKELLAWLQQFVVTEETENSSEIKVAKSRGVIFFFKE